MDETAPVQRPVKVPLVVDADNTLLQTDVSYETFWKALGCAPVETARIVLHHLGSSTKLMHALAEIAMPNADLLPIRDGILERVNAAREDGRTVHLVSESDQEFVEAIAKRLGLPEYHFGSKPGCPLTGEARAELLLGHFGRGGFDYAGNGPQHLPSWDAAREVVSVAPSAWLHRKLQAMSKPIDILESRWQPQALLKEFRPRQWIKNLILFFPLIAAHRFDPATVLPVVIAVMAFSLAASAIYILNDLLDLEADRVHPEKCRRPLASGELPIPVAMSASAVLGILALALALAVGPPIAGWTLLYMAGSLCYSIWLKRLRWLDVVTLAFLFLIRILAGASAADITIPPSLLTTCLAALLALACVKRVTALSRLRYEDHLPGRGYTAADLLRLERLAYAMVPAVGASFLFYALGPASRELYSSPVVLSLAIVPVLIWLLRIVRLSSLGREDYDPLRFVLRDRPGLAILLLAAGLVVLAA